MIIDDRSTNGIWRPGMLRLAMFATLATLRIGSTSTFAQETPVIQGNFVGTLGPGDLDALAGAGAIRSTADDMLTYLEANLHPEKFASRGASAASKTRTLPTSLAQSHELRADAGPGMRIALAWIYNPATGNYWHNGETGGYSSFAFFNPKKDYAAVILMNTAISANGSFADLVGQHIAQRFAGLPSVSLGN